MRIYANDDLVGVEVGGAVKNVLAIATGLCDGMDLGLNARAALVTRVVESLLYNVSATDAVSFVATALFLAFVAILAAYIPARRATAVDPLVALRAE